MPINLIFTGRVLSCEDSLRQSVAVGALSLTDRLVFLSGLND